ncbi:glycoside hydrolase superfamily [Phakopsora pachyrhizi]|uniref:mannan endo-1,4-beta-mannosidase n=2 Tax=Phakopsora pachyrhizi TaxID=170000 RepID=A0AAV0AUB9_PHAPC|nr:glycoside hydrolase superfamily [Phakopsora pachyrhizi]
MIIFSIKRLAILKILLILGVKNSSDIRSSVEVLEGEYALGPKSQNLTPPPSKTVLWSPEIPKPSTETSQSVLRRSCSEESTSPAIPTAIATFKDNEETCSLSQDLVVPEARKNCVGIYHNKLATTISGAAGGLPTPRAFIKKEGTLLKAGSQIYRPVGPNIYWLGLDENVGQKISYPTRGRVREAIAIAAAMGANTIRSITLGVSTGHPLSVWPSKGETNEDAFDSIDYAIATARHYGLRFYHGGKYDFLTWEGINSTNADAEMNFYRNEGVIKTFKQYIEVILNHVNQFNGLAFKDDPTILAWETGNELGAFDLEQGAPPGEWTEEIASYIKSIDRNHLVIDGSDGLMDTDGDDIEGLAAKSIDIVSDHLYPIINNTFWQDHTLAMVSDKVLLIGEYDWTGSNGGLSLNNFYNEVRKTKNVGDIAWSVMAHDESCCRYITHDDGYSIYYPNGNARLMQNRVLRLVQHWYHFTGRDSPSVLPAVSCPQPEWLKQT